MARAARAVDVARFGVYRRHHDAEIRPHRARRPDEADHTRQQKRIVEKVDALMAIRDELGTGLRRAEESATALA